MPTEMNDTAVTKWLKKQGAEQFIEEFYTSGYYNVEDVDDDAITTIIPKDLPGLRNRLRSSLKKLEPEPSKEPLAIPSLPPGTTLDLSQPDLTAPGDITFRLPSELSTQHGSKEVISPESLSMQDWMVIAKHSQMLYGFRMDQATPSRAETPVLDWMVPETSDFFRDEHLIGEVTSNLSYTEQSYNYVKSGFSSQSATAGFPFCAASFEYSQREKQAKSQYYKRLYMTGTWRFTRASLVLDKCTKVSSRFVTSIHNALQSETKFAALNEVFAKYGHTYARKVMIGGQLYFQQTHSASGSIQTDEVERTIKEAVEIKKGQVTGSAGGSFQAGIQEKVTAQKIATSTTFVALGGDTTLAGNPSDWSSTVKDPNLWTVISNDELYSTIDLLEDGLKKQVLAVWENAPHLPELHNRVVTIRTPAIYPPAIRILGKNTTPTNSPKGMIQANNGMDHPTRLPYWVLSDPKDLTNHQVIAWRLKFSGHYGDPDNKKDPMFWIELVDQDELLMYASSVRFRAFVGEEDLSSDFKRKLLDVVHNTVFNGAFATVSGTDQEQLPISDRSARYALWYIKPADPGHSFGPDFEDAYILEQVDTHEVLSSRDDASAIAVYSIPVEASTPSLPGLESLMPKMSFTIPIGVPNNANEFSILVTPDYTAAPEEIASYCWILKPLERKQS